MYVYNMLYIYYMKKKKTIIGIYFRNKEILLLIILNCNYTIDVIQ